jgi:L-lactate dehydrogenase complex protein LldF
VRINIPHMLIGLRELQHHKSRIPLEGLAYWLWKEVLRHPWLYRLALRAARWALRPLAKNGWLSKLPGPGGGWTQARDFPAPAQRPFRDVFASIASDERQALTK